MRAAGFSRLKAHAMSTEIIQVSSENASCLAHVAVDVFDAEPTPAYLQAYLRAPHHALFVALADGMVIGQARGMLQLQPDGPTVLYIDNLGVTPARKRQGVGTRLVAALIAWGRANGCDTAWLGTETGNEEAKGFYEAFGFGAGLMMYYDNA
jgi:ribosomal protein S18 acetylase RimI-like enzyme